ncbi:glutathione S-transferase family protein [Pseudaestuariivita rosea]|uniref:glutathione S-transferase family protein n=1 Tax=Pseudaestuariivita rosea TaxID=2763263 RepID=UPI001ABB036D|nr:glutathione S-transferase family protein [Pseudaestuariivita rosea]
MSKMTLYYRPGACALAPHILLNAIGAEYDAVLAPRDASYRAINPNGAVPALKLSDGYVLTQCNAILQYICEDAGREDLLGGDDTRLKAETAKWCAFFTGDFHPAFFPIFVPHRYTADDSDAARDKVKQAGMKLVRNGLDQIEAHLGGREQFVGASTTVADFYAVPMLRWVTLMIEGGLGEWPATNAFYDRICATEVVQKTMVTHGIKA